MKMSLQWSSCPPAHLEGRELFLPLELRQHRAEGSNPVLQMWRHFALERAVTREKLLVSLGEPAQ